MRHLARHLASALVLAATLALTISAAPTAGAASPNLGQGSHGHEHGHGHGHGHHRSAKFVVNTEFGVADSPVVRATGPFKSCTTVTDLFGDEFDLAHAPAFYGVKALTCAAGDVILSYGVVANPKTFDTHGSWTILFSTLPGVRSGGGKLFGDSGACDDVTGEGCVLDTFWLSRH
jgi:hypothetical protein